MIAVDGPTFDQLRVGDVLDDAPALTLTAGHAALHQAIVGDRLRLPLDRGLAAAVTGAEGQVLHPALVCDVAIGQSTALTRRVIGNLFYRGLVLARCPLVGDTLTTRTEVVALRENSRREGRPPTGLAALRVRCEDQEGREVLDFHRCAMLPLAPGAEPTGEADDLDAIPATLDAEKVRAAVAGWRLDRFGPPVTLEVGERWEIAGGDVVSSAPELARLTLNLATAHHDAFANASGRRLVYGGQTIGIAAAQATRALPELVTIVAWHSCDHLGPVYEGDTLRSELELERVEELPERGSLVHLRSRVRALRRSGAGVGESPVLDWRFVAVTP